jgi:hypothetical protein
LRDVDQTRSEKVESMRTWVSSGNGNVAAGFHETRDCRSRRQQPAGRRATNARDRAEAIAVSGGGWDRVE